MYIITKTVNVCWQRSTTTCTDTFLARIFHFKFCVFATTTMIDFKSFCTHLENRNILDDNSIHRNSPADIFIDICTSLIVAAAPEQTSILSSLQTTEESIPFCVAWNFCQAQTWQLSPFLAERK